MKTSFFQLGLLPMFASAFLLSACSGNNDDPGPDPTPAVDMAKPDMAKADMAKPDMAKPDMVSMDLCLNTVCDPGPPVCEGSEAVTYSSDCDASTGECVQSVASRTACSGDTPLCLNGTCIAMASDDPDPTCENYCDVVMANCSGDQAQYGSREECVAYCGDVGAWSAGAKGDSDGDTIACRIYHGNSLAMADPATYCDQAGPSGANVCGSWCDVYCALGFEHCEGPNKLYDTEAECQSTCAMISTGGEANDTEFDSVQCRIYHLGAPASQAPDTHCSHGAEMSTAFCVGSRDDFVFATDAPNTYTRYDRLGMPAVSTALITNKAGYNAQDPIDDAAMNNPYVSEIVTNLTGLHAALDAQLIAAGLTPCSMDDLVNDLPECVGQRVAQGGPIVASLVIPDHLTLNPNAPSGFPNGRELADPVMDITLAIILLDMQAHTPSTLATLPLNPTANDRGVEGAFLTTFPYLHPPHMLP